MLTYFVLVFALSWGAILPFTRGPIPTSTADPMFMFVILSAPVAPTIAGLLMTGLIDGKAGYRTLLARLLRWRVGLRWHAMALLFAPLLTATILLGLSQFSAEFRPKVLTTQDVPGLLVLGVATAVPVHRGRDCHGRAPPARHLDGYAVTRSHSPRYRGPGKRAFGCDSAGVDCRHVSGASGCPLWGIGMR